MEQLIPGAPSRIARAAVHGADGQVLRLLRAAQSGLPWAHDIRSGDFAQTVRGGGGAPVREGTSLRYSAIAALGIGRLDLGDQRYVLSGATAVDVAGASAVRAKRQSDPGTTALAVWASAEVLGATDTALMARLETELASGKPIPTVDLAWMLIAALRACGPRDVVAEHATARLLETQGARGLFPHMSPPETQSRWRRHVGCFADQIYPVQALARMFAATQEPALLAAAERTADRLCELQGPAGQWWWHYDARTGDVVERFPVYSVHQHGMAPMALFDLADAGGTDRTGEIVRGVRWLDTHPEIDEELIDEEAGLIWRKVGRREPGKTVRKLSAVTTAMRSGLYLPRLDRAFPANRVDHECRPYELGWLLYAWLPARDGDAS
ncbi:hypothetical protein [Aeromicrobium sp. A1-2]|uniref:hypothetical protein n=1 Tax=Aeromicrobium sp. A1-2 TaxID=2107713 RepID=UPI0013C2F210|nr:hypothetical protein [Aeromicrobium sp. A1-2]